MTALVGKERESRGHLGDRTSLCKDAEGCQKQEARMEGWIIRDHSIQGHAGMILSLSCVQ